MDGILDLYDSAERALAIADEGAGPLLLAGAIVLSGIVFVIAAVGWLHRHKALIPAGILIGLLLVEIAIWLQEPTTTRPLDYREDSPTVSSSYMPVKDAVVVLVQPKGNGDVFREPGRVQVIAWVQGAMYKKWISKPRWVGGWMKDGYYLYPVVGAVVLDEAGRQTWLLNEWDRCHF